MPPVKRLEKMSDGELAELIQSDYRQAFSFKNEDKKRFDRYLAIYKTLDPPEEKVSDDGQLLDDDEGRFANVYLGIGAASVDTAVSQLYNALFSTEDYVRISASNWEDEILEYRMTAHLKKRHLEMQFRRTVLGALQTACCFDYAVTGSRWLLRPGYEQRRVINRSSIQLGKLKVPYQDVSIESVWVPDAVDRSDTFLFNYERCYHDWSAKSNGFEDCRFFIDDRDEMIAELALKAKSKKSPWGKYENIQKVIKAAQEAGVFDEDVQKDQDPDPNQHVVGNRRVKIIRYWTADYLAETCMGIPIFRMPLSGWPLQRWTIYDLPNSFPGMGILQRMERIQYDINASLNARRNFQNLVSDPFGVIDQSLVASEDGAPRVTSGKMLVSKGGQAKDKVWVYTPGVNTSQDVMQDIQINMDVSNKVVGLATENAQGAALGGRTTAHEAGLVNQGLSARVFQVAEKIEFEALIPNYEQTFKLEQTFMSKEETYKWFGPAGEEWMQISPEDYKWSRMPRFTAMGSSFAKHDAIAKQNFFQLLNLAITIPGVADVQKIFVKAAQLLDPKDFQQFVKDPRKKTHNVPPNMEHLIIASGFPAEVSPENNHQEHIAAHEAWMQTPDFLAMPPAYQMNMKLHIQQHQQGGMIQAPQPVKPMQDASDPLRGQRVA